MGNALDARRQRIIVSLAEVNPVKWWCLYLQALCELLVIGFVHCDNRLGSAIAMGLFATGVATSVLLIAAHDRPFTGRISVVAGAAPASHAGRAGRAGETRTFQRETGAFANDGNRLFQSPPIPPRLPVSADVSCGTDRALLGRKHALS